MTFIFIGIIVLIMVHTGVEIHNIYEYRKKFACHRNCKTILRTMHNIDVETVKIVLVEYCEIENEFNCKVTLPRSVLDFID